MVEFYQCTVAISAVVGHCFPIWLRFKGGKGVATGFGVILSLNLNIGIVALLIWMLIAKVFKISSMSALIAYFLIPLHVHYARSAEAREAAVCRVVTWSLKHS